MRRALWLLPLLLLAGESDPTRAAMTGLDGKRLIERIKVLASDGFEGRAPGSRGEDRTVRYLVEELRKLGLQPGNPDGTFIQKVPLVGFTATPDASFRGRSGRTVELRSPDDFVAVSRRETGETKIERSDIVFVGYGAVAPEYGWDDFKGVDVRGKTLLMLVGDPPVPSPEDPTRLDETVFKGKAMTYYGRWTYKYEIAAARGARAAILIHETGPAGYPWEVVKASWAGENFDLRGRTSPPTEVEAWLRLDKAGELLAIAGKDLAQLRRAAQRRDFRPVLLDVQASFHVPNKVRHVDSQNVVARLPGADPRLAAEHVIYTAHWDHLGRDERLTGDQIFNGAVDNASGTAALLELARAYTRLPSPPRRSVLFLSVTAEEKGLLGSRYYVEHPLYPLDRTACDINMDGFNLWGRTRDVVIVGRGQSTLEDVLDEAARRQGRVVKPDPEPEKGFYYRSDHFEFAKRGVPALDINSGVDFIGRPPGYGQSRRDEYVTRDYHKVTDEVKPGWEPNGAAEDLQLLFQVGYRVAQSDRMPSWKPGSEFKR